MGRSAATIFASALLCLATAAGAQARGIAGHARGAAARARTASTTASCTDLAVTGDVIAGVRPVTGLTRMTFTCSGAESIHGGPWSLVIKIHTPEGRTSANAAGGMNPAGSPFGSWGVEREGHDAETSSTFVNGTYTVQWLNVNAANEYTSSCGLQLIANLVVEQGRPNGTINPVPVAYPTELVAGCHSPGVEGSDWRALDEAAYKYERVVYSEVAAARRNADRVQKHLESESASRELRRDAEKQIAKEYRAKLEAVPGQIGSAIADLDKAIAEPPSPSERYGDHGDLVLAVELLADVPDDLHLKPGQITPELKKAEQDTRKAEVITEQVM